MKSSQPRAKAPTARQNAIAMGKASRRARPVDLKQKPIQPRTWRHKSQSFRERHARNPKYLLGFVPQNEALSESVSRSLAAPPNVPLRLTPSENQRNCKICKTHACRQRSPKPRNGFVPQNGWYRRIRTGAWRPLRTRPFPLAASKNQRDCKICKIRGYQQPPPEPQNGFVPQDDRFPRRTTQHSSTKPEPAGLVPYAQANTPGKTGERRASVFVSAAFFSYSSPAAQSLSQIVRNSLYPANPMNLQSLYTLPSQIPTSDRSFPLAQNG